MYPLLNFYYGIRDVVQGKHEAYSENINYVKVIEAITLGEVEWNITNERHKSFDAK